MDTTLFRNKNLLTLWTGQTVSIIGDAFFNLAVMWVVFEQTSSVLSSAMVGVIWHLSSVFFAPLGGILADKFDRKMLLIIIHLLSALITLILGIVTLILNALPISLAFISIVIVNALSIFVYPVESSIIPDIVERKQLSQVSGFFTTIAKTAHLVGTALAGFLVAGVGAGWALNLDALSFVFVAICIAFMRLPKRESEFKKQKSQKFSYNLNIISDIKSGLAYINGMKVIKSIILLSILVNMAGFIGALYPALVQTQLNAGASVFGYIQAVAVVGGILGGIVAASLSNKIKIGRLLFLSWLTAGFCTIVIGLSTLIWLTNVSLFIRTLAITISSVHLYTIQISLVETNYRGRVDGLIRSLSTILMPLTTLLAGILGDIIGVSILFVISGVMTITVSLISLTLPDIRNAHTIIEGNYTEQNDESEIHAHGT